MLRKTVMLLLLVSLLRSSAALKEAYSSARTAVYTSLTPLLHDGHPAAAHKTRKGISPMANESKPATDEWRKRIERTFRDREGQ